MRRKIDRDFLCMMLINELTRLGSKKPYKDAERMADEIIDLYNANPEKCSYPEEIFFKEMC